MYVTEICLKIAQIKLLYLEISKKKKFPNWFRCWATRIRKIYLNKKKVSIKITPLNIIGTTQKFEKSYQITSNFKKLLQKPPFITKIPFMG